MDANHPGSPRTAGISDNFPLTHTYIGVRCVRQNLLLKLTIGLMYKYDVELLSDTLYIACEEYPDSHPNKYIDKTGVNITFNDDGSYSVNGVVKAIYNFKQTKYKVRLHRDFPIHCLK